MNFNINQFKEKLPKINQDKIKKVLFGKNLSDGLIFKTAIYLLLISIGFVYIYPLLYMLSFSLKDINDILNPMINWVPSKLYLDNFNDAIRVLKYGETLYTSLLVTLIPAIIQTIVASLIGYGFARYKFPLKKMWLMLVILTFIIPSQVYTIPKYVMFHELNILENPLSIILPAFLGQGINSAIFILIFYQFFKIIPQSFFEAAEIEGASDYRIFLQIAVPLAIPSYLTSFLFSLVWYYNETYISSLFLGSKFQSLQIRLAYFVSEYASAYPSEVNRIHEGKRLAATLLIILPMLVVYFIMQRYFIEGVEKSGIAGE